MTSQEQMAWAKKQLSTIMDGNNKTRYKALAATPTDLETVESALLNVAQHKAQSYKEAIAGKELTAFNWVNKSKNLAQDILLLQHQFVDMFDIPMLPD